MSSSGNSRSITEGRSLSTGRSRRQSLGGAESIAKSMTNGFFSKKTPSSRLRPSVSSLSNTLLKHSKQGSRSFDGGSKSLDRGKNLSNGTDPNHSLNTSSEGTRDGETSKGNPDEKPSGIADADTKDCVSGLFYDMMQREVIALRKAGHEKDQSIKDKDDAIEMLAKKVDTLTREMEVEAKKMRREVSLVEKEVASIRVEKEHDIRARRLSSLKGSANNSALFDLLQDTMSKSFFKVENQDRILLRSSSCDF